MDNNILPTWDEERKAVFIPIINKYLDAKCSPRMCWEWAKEYAKKSGKKLPSQHEIFVILFFKNKINAILKEHNGDLLTERAWISTKHSRDTVGAVSFKKGLVETEDWHQLLCVRAVSNLTTKFICHCDK